MKHVYSFKKFFFLKSLMKHSEYELLTDTYGVTSGLLVRVWIPLQYTTELWIHLFCQYRQFYLEHMKWLYFWIQAKCNNSKLKNRLEFNSRFSVWNRNWAQCLKFIFAFRMTYVRNMNKIKKVALQSGRRQSHFELLHYLACNINGILLEFFFS